MNTKSYFEVKSGERVRYQSIDQESAVRHAQGVFRTEEVICDIAEVQHTARELTSKKGRKTNLK
jgi:hypothetical protein